MKISIKDSPKGDNVKFPCLMITKDGYIFWMLKYGCGVVVKHSFLDLGEYQEYWDMSQFTPFNGTVELSND